MQNSFKSYPSLAFIIFPGKGTLLLRHGSVYADGDFSKSTIPMNIQGLKNAGRQY